MYKIPEDVLKAAIEVIGRNPCNDVVTLYVALRNLEKIEAEEKPKQKEV